MNFIGIDPGASGAMVILRLDIDYVMLPARAENFSVTKFKDATEHDIWQVLKDYTEAEDHSMAVIELVHSMPKQGVASSFKFGMSYGFLRGMLTAAQVPFVAVSPQVWQKEMGCLSRGDKNVTKRRAQQLFPGAKITHASADAMLIAELARLRFVKEFGGKHGP